MSHYCRIDRIVQWRTDVQQLGFREANSMLMANDKATFNICEWGAVAPIPASYATECTSKPIRESTQSQQAAPARW